MIIGLTGKKGSGKDSAAAVFEANEFHPLKMAGALKSMLAMLLMYQGVTDELVDRMIEGDLKEVPTFLLGGKSPRYAMQTLGTEWGRQLMGDGFWTDIFINTASTYENVICADIRFPNELDLCDYTYRVVRPSLVSNDNHVSEAMIDHLKVDGEILNTFDDVESFQKSVYELLVDKH